MNEENDFILKGTKMGKFYDKLSEIQRNLNAPKNQTNKFGGYKYRSCSDILCAVKPFLEGLVLTLSDELLYESDGTRYIKATAEITDGINTKSTFACAREELERKGMNAAQITGATSSYARKYALCGLFSIDETNDADTNEYNEKTYIQDAHKSEEHTKIVAKKVESAPVDDYDPNEYL